MKLGDAINPKTGSSLIVSLAARPGKTGETFYGALLAHHGIRADYVACRCDNIESDIELAKLHCIGVSVTMPFKNKIGHLIDEWHCDKGPINTIKIIDDKLHAYNCDYLGLKDCAGELIRNKKVSILGDGAMSDNVKKLAKEYNAEYTVYSRKLGNWGHRHGQCDVLVNTTSVGMTVGVCPVDHLANTNLVIDCVIGNTDLVKLANDAKLQVIKGSDIYVAQFMHQFEVYTGQQPDVKRVKEIAKKVFND